MTRNKKFLIPAAGILSFFLMSGCALFLVGAGVGGGIAISKDTIQGTWDKPKDRVYNASREVMIQEGFIRLEDKLHGKIEGEVRKSQVDIQITQISQKTVQIHVKARKGYKLLPDMDVANDLYNKIYQKIK